MDNYDLGIVGAGVAGCFAALRIAKENKNVKTIVFDIGRPFAKRRRQTEGALGCLPNSDGKLYLNDVVSVSEMTGNRKAKAAERIFNDYMSNIMDFKIVKDKSPSINTEKRIKKSGFELRLNDHIQMYPKDIHI